MATGSDQNLSLLHRRTCWRLGPRAALLYRRDGLFHDLSWSDYRRQADRAAAGLIGLGVQPGDRVAMLAENRHEWLIADYAVLSTGAATMPMHAPLSREQVAYQVGHSEARGIILSGDVQTEKVLAVLDQLPRLEFVISFDPLTAAPPLPTLTWQGLSQRGFQRGSAGLKEIERREAALDADSLATIIYTSGTTGNPKGVMLTHGNLLSNAVGTQQSCDIDQADVLLSWLPYSHIYARTVDHYLTTAAGATVALAESIDVLPVCLQQIEPTWLTAVPRFYEKVWSTVEHLSPDERGDKLRRFFGPRLKQLCSGGAPLPRHICEGFFAAGIPLLEGYGLTESSPVISFNRFDDYKIGTVGRTIPGVEVRIADDGEILTHGPHVMRGYWKNPEATAETIVDGWLKTGDVGTLDDEGFLSITDRKKDLFVTSSGKNVAPSELERLLASDPAIDQAVVYGDGRQFLSALIVPNFEQLEKQAEKLGCTIDVVDDFLATPALEAFLAERIERVMQSVSRSEQVKKFLVLGRPFEMEAEELTASMKVRRRFIIAKYERQLAALYDD